jgi:hypothetical protein
MKIIITENQKEKLMIIRRIPEIKSLIQNLYTYQYPCDFDSLGEFMRSIDFDLAESIDLLDWHQDVEYETIWDMSMEFFHSDIVEYYNHNCK